MGLARPSQARDQDTSYDEEPPLTVISEYTNGDDGGGCNGGDSGGAAGTGMIGGGGLGGTSGGGEGGENLQMHCRDEVHEPELPLP